MTKDAKGHGSSKRDLPRWEVKQGSSRTEMHEKSHSDAKARGAQIGFKNPDSVRLKESPEQQASAREKAVKAFKDIKGGKHPGVSIGKMQGVRSTTKNGKY